MSEIVQDDPNWIHVEECVLLFLSDAIMWTVLFLNLYFFQKSKNKKNKNLKIFWLSAKSLCTGISHHLKDQRKYPCTYTDHIHFNLLKRNNF